MSNKDSRSNSAGLKTPFRFSLKNYDNYWYGVEDNILRKDHSNPQYWHLECIRNWDEIEIHDERDNNLGGTKRNGVIELQFINGLAKAIRDAYYNNGFSAKAYLYIDKYNYSTMQYESYINGYLDFKASRDNRDFISCGIIQGGVEGSIYDRFDETVEIPIATYQKNVVVQPQRLSGRVKYTTAYPSSYTGANAGSVYNQIRITSYFEEFLEVNESDNGRVLDYPEFIDTRDYSKGQANHVFINWATDAANSYPNYLFKANILLYNTDFNIVLPTFLNNKDSSDINIKLALYEFNPNGGAGNEIVIQQTANVLVPANTGINHTFTLSKEAYNITAGYQYYIVLVCDSFPNNWEYAYDKDVKLNVDFDYYTTESTVAGINMYHACQHVINTITNNAATFQSDLLTTAITYTEGIDCRPDRLLLTCGAAVKGLTTPKIKVSLRTLMQALKVVVSAGLGFNGNIVSIEKFKDYYKEYKASGDLNLIDSLGEIEGGEDSTSIYRAEDMLISTVRIGYAPMSEEDSNSNDNYNTTVEYKTAVEGGDSMELICPISASGYEYQRMRVRDADNKRADTGNNDKLFIIQYASTPISGNTYNAFYPSQISSTAYVSNIVDNVNCLNIGLSPARCLIRNADYLLSYFWDSRIGAASGISNEDVLTYKTTEGIAGRTQAIVSQLTTAYQINETANFRLSDYGTRFAYPYYVELNIVPSKDYVTKWDNSPNGVFTYYDVEREQTIRFYPMSVVSQAGKNKLQGYRGILTAGNDLSTLIR